MLHPAAGRCRVPAGRGPVRGGARAGAAAGPRGDDPDGGAAAAGRRRARRHRGHAAVPVGLGRFLPAAPRLGTDGADLPRRGGGRAARRAGQRNRRHPGLCRAGPAQTRQARRPGRGGVRGAGGGPYPPLVPAADQHRHGRHLGDGGAGPLGTPRARGDPAGRLPAGDLRLGAQPAAGRGDPVPEPDRPAGLGEGRRTRSERGGELQPRGTGRPHAVRSRPVGTGPLRHGAGAAGGGNPRNRDLPLGERHDHP